jgi:hypothetical protein
MELARRKDSEKSERDERGAAELSWDDDDDDLG